MLDCDTAGQMFLHESRPNGLVPASIFFAVVSTRTNMILDRCAVCDPELAALYNATTPNAAVAGTVIDRLSVGASSWDSRMFQWPEPFASMRNLVTPDQ